MNKYLKKFGVKVGTTEIPISNLGTLRYEIVDPDGQVQDAFRNRQAADDAVRGYQEAHNGRGQWMVHDNGQSEKVHSVDITPAMKKSLMKEGQPISRNVAPNWMKFANEALAEKSA